MGEQAWPTGEQAAHGALVVFARGTEDDAARGHVDAHRKGFCSEEHADKASREQDFDDLSGRGGRGGGAGRWEGRPRGRRWEQGTGEVVISSMLQPPFSSARCERR